MFSYSIISPFISQEIGMYSINTTVLSYDHSQVKLNAALTGIKFTNYDWDVVSRDGWYRTKLLNSKVIVVHIDTIIRRRYSYDGKAGNISFKIAFEVKVQRADGVSIVWMYAPQQIVSSDLSYHS